MWLRDIRLNIRSSRFYCRSCRLLEFGQLLGSCLGSWRRFAGLCLRGFLGRCRIAFALLGQPVPLVEQCRVRRASRLVSLELVVEYADPRIVRMCRGRHGVSRLRHAVSPIVPHDAFFAEFFQRIEHVMDRLAIRKLCLGVANRLFDVASRGAGVVFQMLKDSFLVRFDLRARRGFDAFCFGPRGFLRLPPGLLFDRVADGRMIGRVTMGDLL